MSSIAFLPEPNEIILSRASALFSQAHGQTSPEPLSDLLEYYRPMLEKLSQKKVGRRLATKVSPSEVTQIAIISAAQRFTEFRGHTVEQFRAWLCVILENAITDHSRRFLTARLLHSATRISQRGARTRVQPGSAD